MFPCRTAAIAFVAVLLLAFVPQDTATAAPTPGLACQLGDAALRIVPEPEATNDYISYSEAEECLEAIQDAAPGFVEFKTIGSSAGWATATGGHQSYDVWLVEVTNEDSPVPFDAKLKHVFQLSVHGNEKGGREGGLRVIEDLARCLDTPGAITAEHPELCDYLDYMVAVFTFPNVDGWVHEEVDVMAANPTGGSIPGGYVRENGNGFDLNRQWPNKGWTREGYQTLSQPEIQASLAALTAYTNIATATDIHGMLTPTDADPGGELSAFPEDRAYAPGGSLLEGLLDAGQSDPLKMFKTTRLAELLKERVNSDPNLIAYNGVPATGAWGGQVMEWGTSWDTIGYVDSGFTGDFFFQNHGLNATAMDFEMAYNHAVCDNHYAACGQTMNIHHVRLVRQVVAVFMESATKDVKVTIETGGLKTAYLHNPKVWSSVNVNGTQDPPLSGWAADNPHDDAYDYGNNPYRVHADEYFRDLRPHVADGDKPGVLDAMTPGELRDGALAGYDVFILAGSAYETIQNDAPALDALMAWTKAGGRLVVTDSALTMLGDAGIIDQADDIAPRTYYAGHTDILDRTHPLAQGLRGIARQTYEAVPLGYEPGQAPVWVLPSGPVTAAGGAIVGTVGGSGSGGVPLVGGAAAESSTWANYGELPVGDGSVAFLGGLLPDPTQEFYHPYGLDAYATSYTGNQLLHNMVGWTTVFAEPPIVVENLGTDRAIAKGNATASDDRDGGDSSGLGMAAAVGAVAAAAVAVRRRR
jgi:hypothetical protein